uniref:TPR_REGION domain-containing protein n=1 Tax=Anopheles merus TaxID=30066 RepID=A0A182UW00_ANOME
MSNKPARLLQKYDLLLEHLDFEYIRQCTNGREVENIVKVLRSGEEGYFPQLTAFAEERLKSLRPESTLLRKEQPLATKHTLPEEQWREISNNLQDWEHRMKTLTDELRSAQVESDDTTVPRIRGTFDPFAKEEEPEKVPQSKVIKYCDYDKWDKFDADTELLKMDLDEERHREMVRLNNQKNSEQPKIVELPPEVKLSQQEKQVIAGKLREKGNDYFRAKEFKEAVQEYGKSLDLFPSAACFNNRAMAIAQTSTSALRLQLPDLPPPNAVRLTIEEVDNDVPEIDFRELIRPKKVIKDKLPDALKQLKKDTVSLIQQQAQAQNNQETEEMTLFPKPPPRRTPLIEEL